MDCVGGRSDDMLEEQCETDVVYLRNIRQGTVHRVLLVSPEVHSARTMYFKTSFSFRILPVWSAHTSLTACKNRSPSIALSTASAPLALFMLGPP